MGQNRLSDIRVFYDLISSLALRVAGSRQLMSSSSASGWPQQGVYFFFEQGEQRTDSGDGLRVVRVGTHAVTGTSQTRLWTRLAQHRGPDATGGGNHRGSIFRLIVGTALMKRDGLQSTTWGQGSNAPREVKEREVDIERSVSRTIGAMPFLWLAVPNAYADGNLRGLIERNSIALLSNYGKDPLDAASPDWLGHHCNREKVRRSGLWNSNHVDEAYDPAFLETLKDLVSKMPVVA